MSEPQLISPLLDGFVMGDPFNQHDGVRSCPALQLETDKKYIVKIISLPATQAKLDALLLAGAYADKESALEYFKDLADGVIEETELLQRLSKHEGFVPFENWQMLPMEDGDTGFDIYLLSEYRPTLENVLRNNEITHLQAINLGLDLCAALSVARRFGYVYGNLRPSNVYICNDREFRIGDLGFMNMDSLPYASLPSMYLSDYTPPEICDAYSALNSTMDTYAVGLILYQVYNNGKLPPKGLPLDAPCHADLALTEIIFKACSLDPSERWQDPVQMGQALANYLQNNTVNDTPIAPVVEEELPIVEETVDEAVEEEKSEPTLEEILAEVDQALQSAPPIITTTPAETPDEEEETEIDVSSASEETEVDTATEEPVEAECESAALEEVEEAVAIEEIICEEESCNEDACDEELVEEEILEGATDEEVTEEEISTEEEPLDETAQMLAQIDELIAHQLPDPPVAPDPIEVTLPVVEEEPAEENAATEDSSDESDEETTAEDDTEAAEDEADEAIEASEEIEEPQPAPPTKRRKSLVTLTIVLTAILLLASAAVVFFQFFYFQPIHDIVLSGTEDVLSVTLNTDTADEILSVKCTDTHGNAQTAPVINGVATFTGLKPGTTYKLEVRVEGLHKLIGKTTQVYTTAPQTTIDGFYAATGPEAGSVILSFSSQGPDSAQWNIHYTTAGEPTKTVTFNGHMVTITGLTVGMEYTFTLDPVTELYLSGKTSITHTASNIIYAEKVEILGFIQDQLAIKWSAPEGVVVPKWYVRCYNDSGYDKTLSTTETLVHFEGLDPKQGYTIEVTADGMTLSTRVYLTANAINIKNIKTDATDLNNLKVTWEHDGETPADGWQLFYSIDGSKDQHVVQCTETSGVITPLIPGAHYVITIQPGGGISALGGKIEFDAPKPVAFSGFKVTADDITFSMCKTPAKENWDRNDVSTEDYTTTFELGVNASFVMNLKKDANKSDENVITLYVIRDQEGNLVSSKYESRKWNSMWYNNYGKLTIPFMPEVAGKYTVEIYFNGTTATTQRFEVIEKAAENA